MVAMKRRSFLQMLGFGVAAAALPTPPVDPRFVVSPEKFASRFEGHTATDGLGDTYEYKYTFVTKTGETLSDIPVGPTGTTSRKIYRSDRRGCYKLIATVPSDQMTFTDGIRR